LKPPIASAKRSGRASTNRTARDSLVARTLDIRIAFSTPLASMLSISSSSSGLRKKSSPPLK
jgi:hypothetical protein